MDREKQIEEMAKVMVDENNKEVVNALSMVFISSAEVLYNAGYRKASDLAEEIFAEIDTLIVRRMIPDVALIDDRLITDIAELKKKYIGKDTNATTNTEN
jgi:hypothetical protein